MISQRPPPQAAGTVQIPTALSACRHSESLFFFGMANQDLGKPGLSGGATFGELHAIIRDDLADRLNKSHGVSVNGENGGRNSKGRNRNGES
jgi:hypothetical protein